MDPLQPIIGRLDPPTDGRVQWRVGGNSALGWRGDTFVREVDATRYVTRYLPNGARRTIRDPQLHFTCCGLASGFAYEFRLAAVNALGVGPWSEPSKPIALTALGTDYERQVEAEEEEQTFLRDQEAEELRRRTEQDEINAARYAAIKRGDLDEAARIAAEAPRARRAGGAPAEARVEAARAQAADGPERPVRHEGPRRRAQAAAGHQESELYELAELERATAFMRDNITLPAVIRLCLDKGVGGDADELDRMRREVRDGEKTELHYLELLCAQLTDAGVARDEIKGAQKLMLRLSGIAGTAKAGAFDDGGAQRTVMEARRPRAAQDALLQDRVGRRPVPARSGRTRRCRRAASSGCTRPGAMDMADGQALGAGRRTRSRRGRSTTRARAAASSPRPGGSRLTPRDARGEEVVVGPGGKPARRARLARRDARKFVGGAAARARRGAARRRRAVRAAARVRDGRRERGRRGGRARARDPTLAADAARVARHGRGARRPCGSGSGVDGGKDADTSTACGWARRTTARSAAGAASPSTRRAPTASSARATTCSTRPRASCRSRRSRSPPLEALRGEDAREPLVVPDRATLGGAPRDWSRSRPRTRPTPRARALATGDPDASAAGSRAARRRGRG